MTKKEKQMNMIHDTLHTKLGDTDRWGNFVISSDKRTFRVKCQDISLRFERKIGKDWKNIRTSVVYYSKVDADRFAQYLDFLKECLTVDKLDFAKLASMPIMIDKEAV